MKDYSKYKLNVIPSPIDLRDWKAEAVYPPKEYIRLPISLDLRDNLLATRDQGHQGSCVAQSGACMKEWQEAIELDFHDYMSPQFIYNNREDMTTEGMWPRDLMNILRNLGIVPEALFPYGTRGKPPDELYKEARNFIIESYATVNTIDGLKTALYKNGPCMIVVPVYNYTERMWKPRIGDDFLGLHAMAVVGYNSKGFIIRNSWGDDWGNNGYCNFSYEDWGLQTELWTTLDATSGEFDFTDNVNRFWYKIKRWILENKGTLLYLIPILIFIIYYLIKEVF